MFYFYTEALAKSAFVEQKNVDDPVWWTYTQFSAYLLNECDYLLIKWSQKKVKMRKIGNSENNAVFRWFFFIQYTYLIYPCISFVEKILIIY